MSRRGRIFFPEQLEGSGVEDTKKWAGWLTFLIDRNECEATSRDRLQKGQG